MNSMVRWLVVTNQAEWFLACTLISVVLADDVIARTATEDEEAAAEIHASRLTCPALTMVCFVSIGHVDLIYCS
jgi:hypothetical protein